MISEPNPTPSYRVPSGTMVDGYRLIRCIGRGWESTSYLATEETGEALRRVKLYRFADPDYLGLTVETFARFHSIGIVPSCCGMGTWRRNRRKTIRFLVFDYIKGKPLKDILRPCRWRRSWQPAAALGVLGGMAAKIAAVHKLDRAVGDFERGGNILVQPNGDAMWCDLDTGSPEEPNTSFEGDRDHFFTILDLLSAHQPEDDTVRRAERALARFRDGEVTGRTFGYIARALDRLRELSGMATVSDVQVPNP